MVDKTGLPDAGGLFLQKTLGQVNEDTRKRGVAARICDTSSVDTLNAVLAGLSVKDLNDPDIVFVIDNQMKTLGALQTLSSEPLVRWVQEAIHKWKEAVKVEKGLTPEAAERKLAEITVPVLGVFAAATVIDLALGAVPNQWGLVSSATTRSILAALGVGAVVAAVSHDPVKIGLLRPYSDQLEATFRNRRPSSFDLFQCYRTRELSPTEVPDARLLDDTLMGKIEVENDDIWNREIQYWGYPPEFARALARSATRTPTFGNLMALARLGLLDRGLAIYSLWGYGMDKVTMPALLDGLEAMNEISNYEGFRSMVEPSYVDGSIEENDLVDYYNKIRVPAQVQAWVLPRLRKSRAKSLATQQKVATVKERELTTSQVQQAYVANLIDRSRAQGMLQDLKYETAEVDILLGLADLQRKTPGAAKLTRLPLSDYEKAYKNKIRSKQEVLERMQDTYDPRDIKLEADLLDIGKE